MISGEELKERKGFIIRKGYGRGCQPQAVFLTCISSAREVEYFEYLRDL